MVLLGGDKLCFVIGLGITLLLCGLIMFYVKQRFSVYDRAITEQSQMLKHLVSSIQTDTSFLRSAQGAVNAAKNAREMFEATLSGGQCVGDECDVVEDNIHRIVVSDDEDDSESDSDSDSDSESESESDTESENDVDGEENVNVEQDVSLDDNKLNIRQINVNDIKVVKLDDLTINENIQSLTSDEIESVSEHFKFDADDTNDMSSNLVDSILSYHNGDDIDMDDSLSNLDPSFSKNKYLDLSKSQLQDLCKEKNLSVKGSKKDLIDRLIE
jgi:hypothetical protein